MSKYGGYVEEPYIYNFKVVLPADDGEFAVASLDPDEARLLALRLIKLADEVEPSWAPAITS